ncbi:Poly A polymerase regulatory subunit [Novymonas esmeraldas]|uniref:Cap-specific mRNA (nucleoside-2'-O-)-methyltransferase n=1 Tax=Novymonas esmeraldas TaxID=1808958 RepID=A0AAW0F3Z4_9TRYP
MGSGYLKRKRQRQELLNDIYSSPLSSSAAAASGGGGKLTARTVHHYPSTLPFPLLLDDAFPAEPYRSRNTDIKSAIHWGQRKLLLSEIQLLCMYCRPEVSYHIVYAGSAPGTHLAFLDEMFTRRHTWELVDPGQFDRAVLEQRTNFWLRNEFFTNATAYGINARRLAEVLPALGFVYHHIAIDSAQADRKAIHEQLQGIVGTLDVARGTEDIPAMYEVPLSLPKGLELLARVGLERNKPLLFISDIRSGSVALPNFEDHVAENMRAQECWTNILHGEQSMLKFRLPYTNKASKFGGQDAVPETRLIREDGAVPYLRGDMLLPIWTRPTSTEGRLVVPQGAFQRDYNVAHVENQFFFFNAKVREVVHFNHIVCHDDHLDHHYDAAAEVHTLLTYLRFTHPELATAAAGELRKEVLRVAHSITEHLGVTFDDAIRRRDALMINQSRKCPGKATEDRGDEEDEEEETAQEEEVKSAAASGAGPPAPPSEWEATTRHMVRLSTYDRARPVWSRNVREAEHDTPSGFWVTTRMPQA